MHAVDVTPTRDEDVDHSDETSCLMVVFDAVVADFLLSISSGGFCQGWRGRCRMDNMQRYGSMHGSKICPKIISSTV
ncbi:hypothetical protein M405DRAFT_805407, partial [Rhizopogon salebrosus TDB-379]